MSTASDPVCRQCRGTMVKGYLPDRGHGNGVNRPVWTAGEPRPSKWLGINWGYAVRTADTLPVQTWRCPRCGLLESYAH